MNRDLLVNLLKRHAPWPSMGGGSYVCECGDIFPNTVDGPDPRSEWARHVANAIYPEVKS